MVKSEEERRLSIEQYLTDKDLVDAGVVATVTGNSALAEKLYRAASEINPFSHLAVGNLGTILSENNERIAESQALLQRSIVIDPEFAQGWAMLGKVYNRKGQFADSMRCLKRSVEISPKMGIFWYLLAGQHEIDGNFSAAEDCYSEALKLDPNNPDFKVGLGMAKMMRGDFNTGMFFYESRVDCRGCWTNNVKPPNLLTAPQALAAWSGSEKNCWRIVIEAEQGTGDLFQMARYAPALKRLFPNAHVVLHCGEELTSLMKRFAGFDEVVSRVDTISPPDDGFSIAAMSLPYLCSLWGESRIQPPSKIDLYGLVHSRPEFRNRKWDIGWCYAGNKAHGLDRFRSMPRELLRDAIQGLAQDDICLQWEGVLSPHLNTWEDTLSIISNCSAVVTIDTAVAHLAASVGTPVMMMIARLNDWRWMEYGTTTEWYPGSMTLYRQRTLGDWGPVIETVKDALDRITYA